MLFYLTSRIVSATAAFLYPGYASYKTLSQRPASEEELERWLMYWSVLGFVIPFYYTLKTLFLLYLSLPQTKGSTYLYITHLQPFFHSHESQIDATLASMKGRVYSFFQDRFRLLGAQVAVAMGQQAQAQQQEDAGDVVRPAQLLGSLWTSYGPAIITQGAALLTKGATAASDRIPTGASAVAAQRPPLDTPHGSSFRNDAALAARKKQLEAELAALSAQSAAAGVSSVPMPTASSQFLSSRVPSETDIRPSDDEGYDDQGRSQPKSGGWFGGWTTGGSSKDGYERVKSD
ncbi:receptor expression-enhancing protein 4 [Coprinopsis sp. MPI-PUGE-AT-0042]|nr:receptor expression-enhancing protein 4 [Coprinopsis sp. MPI-PUGE-AT-0042]